MTLLFFLVKVDSERWETNTIFLPSAGFRLRPVIGHTIIFTCDKNCQ